MSHAFYADAWNRTARRDRVWYQRYLMPALLAAKEKQARDIDATIAVAQELLRVDENVHTSNFSELCSSRLELHSESVVDSLDDSKIYEESVKKPITVPPHDIEHRDDDSLMKPIEPEVSHLLYGCTEKGAAAQYLKARYKKSPEDKFFFRLSTSWDYGWQQKQSRLRARDVNRGRCAILRDTFYRKNNLGPDPRHYSVPSGGEVSFCGEYSCDFN